MKSVMLLLFTLTLFSCKKENKNTTGGTVVTGTLRYYPATKGEDPYVFETDGGESLYFDDFQPTSSDWFQSWQGAVNFHATLTYTDTGKTGCDLHYQLLPCVYPRRVVHVVKYKTD